MAFKFGELLPKENKKSLEEIKEKLPKERQNLPEKIKEEKEIIKEKENIHKELSELYLQRKILEKELEKKAKSKEIKEKLKKINEEIKEKEKLSGKGKFKKEKEVSLVTEKFPLEKEIEKKIFEEIKEKKQKGEKLSVEEELVLANRPLWEKRKFEIFKVKEKKEKGKPLSLREAMLLQIEEFLMKKKEEIEAKEKIKEEKIEEIPPEKIEKKISIKEALKILEEKRENYHSVYLGTLKELEKNEIKVFREIKSEAGEKIKEKVKEIWEAKPEESDKKRKEFVEFLKEKFKEKGFEISNEKAEKIVEVELKKAEYDKAKLEWVKAMKEEGIEDIKIIRALTKETETLKAIEIEKWPPEKKSIFAKVLDGWMKLSRTERILLSSLALTGVGALFPALLPSTAAFCAKYGILGTFGVRVARGFLSANLAQVIGGTFEKFWGSWRIEKKKRENLNELAREGIKLENFDKLDRKIQEILDEVAKSKRRMKIGKALVMLAAGVGASMALTVTAEEVFGAPVQKEVISKPEPQETIKPETKLEEIIQRQKEEIFWTETVEKGESPLSEAKKIYMAHAKELGYEGDLTDKVALEKWAETASTRHIVGQYIVEHQEEYKSLIEKIGPPPSPDDPEYFTKLDQWLHKVPKSTFNEILHHKVPNLVYEGDKIVVTPKGDILAYSPEGELRLGHIPVEEKARVVEEVSKKPEIEETVIEKKEEVGIEPREEKPPIKEIPTTEKVREILWEKFRIVRPAYEAVEHERVLNLLTEEKYEYSPGVFSGTEDVIARDIDALRKEISRIYESLSLTEKAKAQLMTVDEFLKKYFEKI